MIMYRISKTAPFNLKKFHVSKIADHTVYYKRKNHDIEYRSSVESQFYQWFESFDMARDVLLLILTKELSALDEAMIVVKQRIKELTEANECHLSNS